MPLAVWFLSASFLIAPFPKTALAAEKLRPPHTFANEKFRQSFEEKFGHLELTYDRFIIFMVASAIMDLKEDGRDVSSNASDLLGESFTGHLEQNLIISRADGIIYVAYKDHYLGISGENDVFAADLEAFEKTFEIARIGTVRVEDDYFPVRTLREKNESIFEEGQGGAIIKYSPLGGKEIIVLKGVFNPQLTRASTFLSETMIDKGLVREGDVVLDMGGGSGAQAITALECGASSALCLDINSMAIKNVNRNSSFLKLGDRLNAHQSDLFGAVTNKTYDLILFNPPLVHGSPRGIWDRSVYDEGHEVIRRFLKEGEKHLSLDGRIVLLYSSKAEEGGHENLIKNLIRENGFVARSVDTILRNHGERYTVYEIKRNGTSEASTILNDYFDTHRDEIIIPVTADEFFTMYKKKLRSYSASKEAKDALEILTYRGVFEDRSLIEAPLYHGLGSEIYKGLINIINRQVYTHDDIQTDTNTMGLLYHAFKEYFDNHPEIDPSKVSLTRNILVRIVRELFDPFFETQGFRVIDFGVDKYGPKRLPDSDIRSLGYREGDLHVYGVGDQIPHSLEDSIRWDMSRLVIPENSVDVATVFNPDHFYTAGNPSYWNILHPEVSNVEPVIIAAKKVLKPGGWVYIEPSNLLDYKKDYALYEEALRKHGFSGLEKNYDDSRFVWVIKARKPFSFAPTTEELTSSRHRSREI